jgi:FkbM family methyltransferase
MKSIKKKLSLATPKLYKLFSISEHRRNSDIKKIKLAYPKIKIFKSIKRGCQEIYSLSNQDFIIKNYFFKEKKDGFYCDIGGNHPLEINNTRHFEELGWNGIAFEPLPHMGKLWKNHRKAKLFPFALSNKEGESDFMVSADENGETSYIKESGLGLGANSYNIKVKTRIFQNVMDEENITHINYLSMDVEGHEKHILKGIDFHKTKIDVLTIENISGHRRYGDDNIRNLMIENDYIFWGRTMGADDIYVHKNFKYS